MWTYKEQRPGDPTRDPIVGEFFSSDAISNPAQALVREGIQNSMDAAVSDGIVEVRITLANTQWALSPERASFWLDGAWPHVGAKGNGLRNPPSSGDACPFLVFEDFGTTGLTGDVEQAFDEPTHKNAFFYFFRAEGRSSKGETDRGRWGVGKHVFPRSSGLSATFGYTARSTDGRRLLMGHSILKSHKLGGHHYTPDGYFGAAGSNPLVLPIVDPATLDAFRKDFRLSRVAEPGLSIVVPFVDPEFSHGNLVAAVIRDYFLPILTGVLKVSVSSDEGTTQIQADTLLDAALGLDEDAQGDVLGLVDLAEWYVRVGRENVVNLPACDPDRPVWAPELLPPPVAADLRSRLEQGERLAIRCNLTVREKGAPARNSHFDVCLWQTEHDSGKPVFIREGLIISDVKAPRTRGVRALVIADDKPIATLLGDSENPSHTQWQKDSSNFKGKYIYGKSYLDFVATAPYEMVHRLRADEATEDKTLLLDIFSLPSESEAEPKRLEPKPKEKPGTVTPPDLEEIEPRKKRFRLQKVLGGFCVKRGDAGMAPPATVRIRVGYDIRRGHPLKKYNAADFELNRAPIVLDPIPKGIEVRKCEGNEIVADITDPDFHLTVVGFDERRDVYVQVTIQEGSDAS